MVGKITIPPGQIELYRMNPWMKDRDYGNIQRISSYSSNLIPLTKHIFSTDPLDNGLHQQGKRGSFQLCLYHP